MEAYVGEIRTFGFSWAPQGWAKCDGSSLPINNHMSLYSLIGTTYGGDGRTTFNLPDIKPKDDKGIVCIALDGFIYPARP